MTIPFPAQAQHLLLEHLKLGCQRSQELGHQVIVSVSFPVNIQISEVVALALSETSPSLFWAQPSEGIYFAGAGKAYSVTGSGRGRFGSVRNAHRQLLEDAVINAPEQVGVGPVCFSGFRFTEDGTHEQDWNSFPDGLLLLPKVILCHTPQGGWRTFNASVGPNSELSTLAEECVEVLSKVSPPSILPRNDGRNESFQHFGGGPASYKRASWKQAVQQVLHEISEGRLEKVVLARRVRLQAPYDFSIKRMLEKLDALYPECRIFAYHSEDTWFLGATPELLVQLRCGRVSSVCLAGTTRRGKTEAEDYSLSRGLLDSQKDRAEHALAVQAVQQVLAKFCQQLNWNAEPELMKLRNVYHLATSFSGNGLPGLHILDLVARLHPTPSVAGLPQDSALKTIQRLEGMDRGWYSGPVGWINQAGDGEFAVAIRSALVHRDRASMFAGAGIVAGSDKDKEWEEVELKLNALRPLIEGAVNLAV